MKSYTKFIVYKKNILQNFEELRKNTKSKICIMVKADGYGYGMLNVAKLLDKRVDFFGVANGTEGLYLRGNGIKNNILVCGIIKSNLINKAIQNDISITCDSLKMAKKVGEIAKKLKKNANLHLKINTGMNRLGASNFEEIKRIKDYISHNRYLKLQGVFTHCGVSENGDEKLVERQHNIFCNMVKKLRLNKNVIVHFANSGCYCLDKKYHHNMVRIGKILYGVMPKYSNINLNVIPIFSIRSKVIQVQKVPKGEYIGYGVEVHFEEDVKIAVLPIGYADGFISCYVGCYVTIKGKKCEILSICMDLTIVKIGDKIKAGDDVWVMGVFENDTIPVTEYSEKSHKIPSQVIANINKNRLDVVLK